MLGFRYIISLEDNMKKVFLAMLILLMSISSVGFGRSYRHNRPNNGRSAYKKVCIRRDRRGRCLRYEYRRVPYHRHNNSRPPRFR